MKQQMWPCLDGAETITPPIFCEANKPFWIIVRRLLIAMLRELDKAYNWDTFGRKERE